MHDKEPYHITRSQLLASMDVAMGGRVAEEIVYGLDKVTVGKYFFIQLDSVYCLVTIGANVLRFGVKRSL